MQLAASTLKRVRAGTRLIVLVLGAQLLLLGAMEASPALHKAIHHDADDPDHECAVTLFAKGLTTPVALPVLVGTFLLVIGLPLPGESLIFSSADYRFSASRAPPAVFA